MSSTSTKLTARSSSGSTVSSTRKQNRSHFAKYYSDLCHIQHSHPLSAIKQNLDKGILDFYCDRIKFEEWWSIINALSYDKTLHFVAIRSRHPQKRALETADTELKAKAVTKQPVVTTRFVLMWLSEAIKMCLSQSTTLTVLELEGLPLSGTYLTSITEGLMETGTLQHLSLFKCPIQDEGAEVLCHAIKNLPSVISLDLSYCELSDRGAETIAGLIKYQKLNRYSEAWKQTLRYRDPDVEAMPGLRRITINNNPNIGDRGIHVLAEEIKDDLWLRALDVQDCGLTDVGGKVLVDLLENNSNLVIVDGRGNPYMNEEILVEIMNQLALNNQNKGDSEYKWINKNPDLTKKKSQLPTGRLRPWTCQSSTRLISKAPPRSEFSAGVTSARPLQLKRSNTTLNGDLTWRKQNVSEKLEKNDTLSSENQHLRLQLRDLTLVLSQEVRDKLALMEENKILKEKLEKGESEKKKFAETQNNKLLIDKDTVKVIEETISRFGMYMEEKNKEDEETSESTTNRSNDEYEVPQLVSNLQEMLKNTSSFTEKNNDDSKVNQRHKEKIKISKSETRTSVKPEKKLLIDLNIGDTKKEVDLDNQRSILEKKRKSKWLKNRPKDQIIWEEEETSSNCGDPPRNIITENGKSRAQAVFRKIMESRKDNTDFKQKNNFDYNTDNETTNSQDEESSSDSDYDSKSAETLKKPLSSSYEDNSS